MGKLNNKSGVEIIPLNDNSSNSTEQRLKMQRIPYMSDPTIVPRVQKYLENNVDKTYVDINVMADELQQRYREYAKRKRNAFRTSVKKAYSIVLQSYGLEDQESSDDDDDDILSDEEDDEEHKIHDDSMNNQLVELYTRQQQKPKQIDENVLIDISSEDSEDEVAYRNNAKKSNGASTSQKEALPTIQAFVNNKHLYDKRIERSQSDPPPQERGKKRKYDGATLSPIKNLQKKKKQMVNFQETTYTFKNIGGMDKTLEDVCKLLLHIKHPELYKKIGISPPRGFLLHGPPGCGKTLLANAIAGELNVPLIKVAAPELVAGVSGESEQRIRELFEQSVSLAPCILFIDEIDAITPNRQNAQKEMERRIVAQLLSCLDDLGNIENGNKVLVIGATNRPDAIDPALRRAGRFDREICLGIPNIQARKSILKVLTSTLRLSEDFDYDQIAKHSPGYVGADLLALTREAAMVAVNRVFNEIKETRKLEQALALQKPVTKPVKPAEIIPEKEDTNKSDAEIIVDDEISKEATSGAVVTEVTNGVAESAVVVVDDVVEVEEENAKEATEESEAQINVEIVEEPKEEESQVEPMPVDLKPLTTLEELISWLHDKSPISDNQLQSLCVTMEDFAKALKVVQPSAKREGFATVPDVTWDNVGSLGNIREELQMAILAPVRHAEQFAALGLDVPAGVLLCGPPGCGKTLLAKAVANEAGINFISVKGPELLNMYVGESERAVRVCFERARNSAPCVIFFDELDSLCPKRSDSREGGATMRVVNQMLTEMDGLESRKGVFLLAASNRPDIIDPAVLRPGRLDKILYVGLPTASDRVDILRAITKNGTQPRLAPDVDVEVIGQSEQCRGYTGADLAALVREAGIIALKEFMLCGDDTLPLVINNEHFTRAVAKIRPSVSEKDQKHYEKLRKVYTAVPEQSEVEEMEYS